jgi:glutamate--cysteine ligase catalytic subunit
MEMLCVFLVIFSGIDKHMAQHIAHLFIRDTIILYKEKLDQNDEEDVDHFENINSTNWQSLRFKLPPPNSGIGWRVEFRTTEVLSRSYMRGCLGKPIGSRWAAF